QLGDVGEALSAIERGRARSLLDEMNMGGVDLQIGRSAVERQQLHRQESAIKERIASLEKQLSGLAADKQSSQAQERTRLEADLAAPRADLYDHYRQERSTSPVYHNLLAVGAGPPRLSQLQRHVVGSDGLLLVYLCGAENSYLLSIGPDKARVVTLTV